MTKVNYLRTKYRSLRDRAAVDYDLSAAFFDAAAEKHMALVAADGRGPDYGTPDAWVHAARCVLRFEAARRAQDVLRHRRAWDAHSRAMAARRRRTA